MTSELLPVSERASLMPLLLVVLALPLLVLLLLLNPAVVASHRQLPAVLMQNSPLLQAATVTVPTVAHSSMSVSQLAPLKPVPAQSHNCVVLF